MPVKVSATFKECPLTFFFFCVNIIVLLIVKVILDLIGGSAQTGNLSVLKCISIGV